MQSKSIRTCSHSELPSGAHDRIWEIQATQGNEALPPLGQFSILLPPTDGGKRITAGLTAKLHILISQHHHTSGPSHEAGSLWKTQEYQFCNLKMPVINMMKKKLKITITKYLVIRKKVKIKGILQHCISLIPVYRSCSVSAITANENLNKFSCTEKEDNQFM